MPNEAANLNDVHSHDQNSGEIVRLQAQLAELAGLAGEMAHEIRNPLSTIRLNLDLLAEDLPADETPARRRARSKLETIQGECLKLEQTLNQFLAWTRSSTVSTAPVSLNETVRQFLLFIEPLAQAQSITIRPHLAANLPPVRLDPTQWQQVLQNLTQNAFAAMPSGGAVEILTYEHDEAICLDLIDHGEGMDEQTRAQIFTPFFSTRSSGTGLGLSMCRRVVENHGGTLECDSETGQGTRMRIRLPRE